MCRIGQVIWLHTLVNPPSRPSKPPQTNFSSSHTIHASEHIYRINDHVQ